MFPPFFCYNATEADKSQIKVFGLNWNQINALIRTYERKKNSITVFYQIQMIAKDVDVKIKGVDFFFSIKIDVNWVLANQSKDKHSNWKSIDEMLPVLASGKLTHEYSVCFDASLWCQYFAIGIRISICCRSFFCMLLVISFSLALFVWIISFVFFLCLSLSLRMYEMKFCKRSMVYILQVCDIILIYNSLVIFMRTEMYACFIENGST